jgi:hypothetical protein
MKARASLHAKPRNIQVRFFALVISRAINDSFRHSLGILLVPSHSTLGFIGTISVKARSSLHTKPRNTQVRFFASHISSNQYPGYSLIALGSTVPQRLDRLFKQTCSIPIGRVAKLESMPDATSGSYTRVEIWYRQQFQHIL